MHVLWLGTPALVAQIIALNKFNRLKLSSEVLILKTVELNIALKFFCFKWVHFFRIRILLQNLAVSKRNIHACRIV